MTHFKAKIIASSTNGVNTITTFNLGYPRFIHAELLTHRVFSKNSSSSRAIPGKVMRKAVWDNPAMPIHWGANRPGMQATEELTGWRLKLAKFIWRLASKSAVIFSWALDKVGCHKQIFNRPSEPFQWMNVVLTGTEFENFYALRAHKDAQPEFQKLAVMMKEAMDKDKPVFREPGKTEAAWHLPYVTSDERVMFPLDKLLQISTARCARVSYNLFEGGLSTPEADASLYHKLVGSMPKHMSPAEHQGRAILPNRESANFRGWFQHRKLLEN
jgi:hypothetical protein